MAKIIYSGFFLKNAIIALLPIPILNQHITHQFHPDFIPCELLGEELIFRLTGYANNGMNEGYKVEFVSGSDAVAEAFNDIKNPHVTVSLGEGGIAKTTGEMSFAPLCAPLHHWVFTAVYGVYTSSGTVFTG